ncbi:tryptophan synthase subunit alpha [Opitutales bacterium]|nr:tryptophan synthase subunit alpha [Opitutales bacterium]
MFLNNMENSDRIAKLFAQKKKEGLSVFIGYVCACDPDFENSLSICKSLLANGVDLLELGVPFSDPLADGQTNQLAAQRALDAGCLQEDVLRLVRAIREFSEAPIVFYTYYNLVFSQGVETYVQKSIEAGVDGLLTLDLPPEEADDLVAASRERGMKNIFIVAPTTPEERIPLIAASASGFLYYVSREGVTGEREDLAGDLAERVATIRRHADLPVVVGFGISNSKQVREVGEVADGVVVGSALVNCIPKNIESIDQIPTEIGDKARELAQGLQPLSA